MKKGFSHKEPTMAQIKSFGPKKAKEYLAKERKEGGKGEPKAWHRAEMKVLKKKVK